MSAVIPQPLTRPRRILLVDDSLADLELMREAFAEAASDVELTVAASGRQALEHLGRVAHGELPAPDLAVIDLNMPQISGWDVISAIGGDQRLGSIAVVIMTTSNAPLDRQRAQTMKVGRFLVKPLSFAALVQQVRGLVGGG
jgi:CheY-like chemotaxis protein